MSLTSLVVARPSGKQCCTANEAYESLAATCSPQQLAAPWMSCMLYHLIENKCEGGLQHALLHCSCYDGALLQKKSLMKITASPGLLHPTLQNGPHISDRQGCPSAAAGWICSGATPRSTVHDETVIVKDGFQACILQITPCSNPGIPVWLPMKHMLRCQPQHHQPGCNYSDFEFKLDSSEKLS